MHVIWINEPASFIGGCEGYIFNTVAHLKRAGVYSTLLYNPLLPTDVKFIDRFDAAFPIVDLPLQLAAIRHDLVFLHQLDDDRQVSLLASADAPVIKFFHDHRLFCLRGDKLPYFSNERCHIPAGCRCYPLGAILVRKKNRFGIGIRTLAHLRRSQEVHRQLDGFVVASHYMAFEATSNGFRKEKIHAIAPFPFAVDAAIEKVSRNRYELLFVGQLIRSKGLDVLLKALALLPPVYRLIVAGTGRQEASYRKLAASLQLQERVDFLGVLPQRELVTYYRRAGCVVVPSRWPEPFGLVGLEAMQWGAPVVACNVGGIPEWLEEGKNGLLVSANAPKAIAQAVLKICENPPLAQSMGHEGQKAVKEKFSAAIHCQKLMLFFQECIAEKRGRWGHFTFDGSEELERALISMLGEIKWIIKREFPESLYRAILLVGSYGKGEGGVEYRDGKEFPHNNLDFLVITKAKWGVDLAAEKAKFDALLLPITAKYGIGFDTSFQPEKKLMRSLPTLLGYEFYHGHKVILGDATFVSTLPFSKLSDLPVAEFQALMVNRGTLMLINEWILHAMPEPSLPLRKVIIKHAMKAIIGFGDATLYFLGKYHWSYRERQLRARKEIRAGQQSGLSDFFRSLYEEAASFRFHPFYERYLTRDLADWMGNLRSQLETAYLECERLRLGMPPLQRGDCVEMSLRALQSDQPFHFRRWLGLLKPTRHLVGESWKSKWAFLCLTPRRRLAALFPLVAFGWGSPQVVLQAAKFLDASSTGRFDLIDAYLKRWSDHGDVNFRRSQGEWGIDISS